MCRVDEFLCTYTHVSPEDGGSGYFRTSATLPTYAQYKHPGTELTSAVGHRENLKPVIYNSERLFPVHRVLESIV
jgi:hypothetical protein